MFGSADNLIQAAFTQAKAFEDFVRAAEGVPRDAVNILSLAAQKPLAQKISVPVLRVAARNWYQRDKEAAIRGNTDAQELLHWIIDRVIEHRKARAFLLKASVRNPLIDALFDARLLHVAKRSISSKGEPDVRYDAYKLDFGAYVDLLATKSAPLYFFADGPDDEGFVDVQILQETGESIGVPLDDYRAIRRAIPDIDDFTKRNMLTIAVGDDDSATGAR